MRCPVCVLAVLLAAAACDDSQRASRGPAGPSPTSVFVAPVALPGASPDAIPIAVGQAVNAAVAASDQLCPPDSPNASGEPCQRFAVTASTSGVLTARVSSDGPSGLSLRVGTVRQWGVTALSVSVSVEAGSTYEIAVTLHEAAGGSTRQAFELATSLTPR